MDILDTTTNTWSKGPSMAKRRATQDCIVTEHNGEKGVMVCLNFFNQLIKILKNVHNEAKLHSKSQILY